MRIRLLAGLVAVSVALVACGSDDGSTEGAAPSADLAFEAQTVTGETVDVGDYAGTDLVIWFWAPW
ncbi:hypothetical protein [Actinospongicola halichondriae]|uniref:hypothetical protein n=1 Tax=Actinospongicola halichondriae TaxID=3236844 RepID=UPI003D3A642C